MSKAADFLKKYQRMPTSFECEDSGWTEGYNENDDLVIVFDDDSRLIRAGDDAPDGIVVE